MALCLTLNNVALAASEKEVISVQPNVDSYDFSASMEITVGNCPNMPDQDCNPPSPVTAAMVLIYATEEDRFFNENIVYEKTTNANGQISFTTLAGGKTFYLRTISAYGVRETTERTPSRGVAFHEILFNK
ncbi:MAG: hypothetical protein AAGH79_06915 [Bacteroidota bacterium]